MSTANTHQVHIQPLDTVFFRDGKPFSMGDETWAEGIFPPPPSVIYGALRSAYMAGQLKEKELSELIKITDALEIEGIFLTKNEGICLPLPLDLYLKNDNKEENYTADYMELINCEDKGILSNAPTSYLLYADTDKKTETGEGKYIPLAQFRTYINGNREDNLFTCFSQSSIRQEELKIGIARCRKSRTAQEGRLYRLSMHRTENREGDRLGIAVSFRKMELPEKGILQLGGERKAAHFKSVKFLMPPPPKITDRIFKIYLASPAIFPDKEGWKPQSFLNETRLELLTASLGKPLHLGGFNMEKGNLRPKSMQKAVPPGSVYYVRTPDDVDIDDLVKNHIHGKSICEKRYAKQGLGIAFAASLHADQWKKN